MSRWHRVRVMKQDVHGGDGGASRRSSAPSVARVVGGVCGGEPRTTSRGPHLLYIALYDGGPPTMDPLGTPDQGARSNPTRPLGRVGVEIELTPARLVGLTSSPTHVVPVKPPNHAGLWRLLDFAFLITLCI
jgi:hypothetical protein